MEKIDFNENMPDSRVMLRYLNGTASRSERQQLDEWRQAAEANEKDFLHLALLYDARRTQQGTLRWDALSAYGRVRRRLGLREAGRWTVRLAAAASLLIGMVSAFYWLRGEQESTSIVTVQTNAGMRSSIVLPDGSKVNLNAGSTLVYPARYGSDTRWVTLDGEGWFEVAPDAKCPFSVKTANDAVNISVVGTKFNLRAYTGSHEVQATLVEGSIRFAGKGMNQAMTMKPGEELTYNTASGHCLVNTVNPELNTAWKDNRLSFRDTPMPKVLEQLSNFFTVDFEVKDDIINTYTFTGDFDNRPLFLILDYMRISSNISYATSYRNVNGVQRAVIILKKAK